jgi:hypothetical protein
MLFAWGFHLLYRAFTSSVRFLRFLLCTTMKIHTILGKQTFPSRMRRESDLGYRFKTFGWGFFMEFSFE